MRDTISDSVGKKNDDSNINLKPTKDKKRKRAEA